MIEKTLMLLGLKEKEVAVYLELMRLGKATPAQIAKNTDINRATVYSVAKILIKKGLIQEDLGGSTRTLVALPPKELDVLVEKERNRINRREDLVDRAIGELNDLPLNTQYSIPKIRFIEGDNIDLKAETDKWDESLLATDKTKTWWGFQDISFVGHFGDWIEWYWSRVADEKVTVKLLTNDGQYEAEMKTKKMSNRLTKFLSNNTKFTASTWVIGEYLVMIYTKEKPFYMIEIFNPTLAHNYRELFKVMWEKF